MINFFIALFELVNERVQKNKNEKNHYPKMLFHKFYEPITVNSKEEHAKLDRTWKEEPV